MSTCRGSAAAGRIDRSVTSRRSRRRRGTGVLEERRVDEGWKARFAVASLPATARRGRRRRSSEVRSGGLRSPLRARKMADPELEAIRQRRMRELQHGAANQQNAGQEKAQEDAKQEAEERRQMMLAQILSSEARERLSRIALVKPDKARGVEDVLLRAAQTGGISEKVSEERLISLLEQINSHTSKQTKVTIQRRRNVLDDDD